MAKTQQLLTLPEPTLAAVVQAQAATRGKAVALIGSDETLTYADLAARANRYARWALREGLAGGDVVALLMPNRPDYVETPVRFGPGQRLFGMLCQPDGPSG